MGPSPWKWVAAAVALLGASGACAPPDRPLSLPRDLPAAVDSLLAPDSVRVLAIGDGVFYRYIWSPRGPWAVHLVEARLTGCQRGVEVVRAPRQTGMRGGRATVSSMAVSAEGRVLAAVNGDFFTPEGMPLGPEVVSGERRTGRSRPALASRTRDPAPWIGTTGVGADSVPGPGWSRADPDASGLQVIGGYPELLDDGERVGDLLMGGNPGFAARRHPRTAVGYSTDDRRLWLVVVDGRQGEYSTGMTLPELTSLLEALGVEEALNLDGGGSSVLVVGGRTVSRPSDESGERPVVNALLLVEDPGRCRLSAPASR